MVFFLIEINSEDYNIFFFLLSNFHKFNKFMNILFHSFLAVLFTVSPEVKFFKGSNSCNAFMSKQINNLQ